MWWHFLRKAEKYRRAQKHFLVANEDGPLKSWTFLPRVMGSLSDWLSAQWLMSKYMPWFSWSRIDISSFANCKKMSSFNLKEPDWFCVRHPDIPKVSRRDLIWDSSNPWPKSCTRELWSEWRIYETHNLSTTTEMSLCAVFWNIARNANSVPVPL